MAGEEEVLLPADLAAGACGAATLQVENAMSTYYVAVSARLARQPGGPAALAIPLTLVPPGGAAGVSVSGSASASVASWAPRGQGALPTLAAAVAPQPVTAGFPLLPSPPTPLLAAPAFLEVTTLLMLAAPQSLAPGDAFAALSAAAAGTVAWETLTTTCFTIGTCCGAGAGFVAPATSWTNWPAVQGVHAACALSTLAAPGAAAAPAAIVVLLQDGVTATAAVAAPRAAPAAVAPARLIAAGVLLLGLVALVVGVGTMAFGALRALPARLVAAAHRAPADARHSFAGAADSWGSSAAVPALHGHAAPHVLR